MCQACVKEEYPNRDTVCLDSGSYMANYAGCGQCGHREEITVINRQTTEDHVTKEEVVTYQHSCKNCNHVIANHEHLFRVEENYQVYEMNCLLCGTAEDQRSIMPWDPRMLQE